MTDTNDHLHEASVALTRARLELHDVAFTLREIADALLTPYGDETLGRRAGHELHELADRLHRPQR